MFLSHWKLKLNQIMLFEVKHLTLRSCCILTFTCTLRWNQSNIYILIYPFPSSPLQDQYLQVLL